MIISGRCRGSRWFLVACFFLSQYVEMSRAVCLCNSVSYCLSLTCLSFLSNSHISVLCHLLGDHSFFFFLLPYWSLYLGFRFLSLCASPNIVSFLFIRPGDLFFLFLSVRNQKQNHIIWQCGHIFLSLIMFFLSHNMVSLSLTAGCLQVLLCFRSDCDSVGSVWDRNAT